MLKALLKYGAYAGGLVLLVGFACFLWIERSAQPVLFDELASLPSCKTALVLGTSPHLKDGSKNPYFTYRMDAAEKLFRAGKVRFLILSGDNRVNDYNEPKSMQQALIRRGLPDSCLVLDHAGLRTFDSMVRCHEIFGQDSVIVVSQQFHNTRAAFISRHIGLICFGYNAQKVNLQHQWKISVREFFSRIKCVLDLYVLNTQPRHLGKKIKIG
jgi:SanA protein